MAKIPKKLDDMQKAIKKSLKKKFPKMKDDELERRAWAIAQDRFKKMKKGEKMDDEQILNEEPEEEKIKKKYDEDGHEIIAENVQLILSADLIME